MSAENDIRVDTAEWDSIAQAVHDLEAKAHDYARGGSFWYSFMLGAAALQAELDKRDPYSEILLEDEDLYG